MEISRKFYLDRENDKNCYIFHDSGGGKLFLPLGDKDKNCIIISGFHHIFSKRFFFTKFWRVGEGKRSTSLADVHGHNIAFGFLKYLQDNYPSLTALFFSTFK